jgi:hypothetical protein
MSIDVYVDIVLASNVTTKGVMTREQAIEAGRQIQRGMQAKALRRGALEVREFPSTGEPAQWIEVSSLAHSAPVRIELSAMRMTPDKGYAGYKVFDATAGAEINNVLWVDDATLEYCVYEIFTQFAGGPPEIRVATSVRADHPNKVIYINEHVATVPPLSPGRQQEPETTDRPCSDCCQEAACRRNGYCAAHRGPFGGVAP